MHSHRYLYLVLCIIVTNFLVNCGAECEAKFDPESITVQTSTSQRVKLTLSDLGNDVSSRINDRSFLQILSENEDIAKVLYHDEIIFHEITGENRWQTEFEVAGIFMGSTEIEVKIYQSNICGDCIPECSNKSLDVIVIRPQRLIDALFIYFIIVFLAIIFINFGAALNMSNIKQLIKRPVGASIGIVGTFVFMPLVSYGMGALLFSNMDNDYGHALALGLFFCGVVPGGGFSNVWTLLLGGNIDLSVSMTTISTLSAFGMIPLWIFTLGRVIFERANLSVPYVRIILSAAGLIVPLGIGVGIRKWKPNAANFMTRILKPLSIGLLIFISVFAIISNFFMFRLFTWQIIVAGLGLPCLGYLFGGIVGKIFCQSNEDAIAISVEIGLKNTGMAIFLLTALEQPMADLTQVVPISVTILTPAPLLIFLIIKKIISRFSKKKLEEQNTTPLDESLNINT